MCLREDAHHPDTAESADAGLGLASMLVTTAKEMLASNRRLDSGAATSVDKCQVSLQEESPASII